MNFFPDYEIVEYKLNPLFEVVFQARFPDFAKIISSDNPVSFQNELRVLGYSAYEKGTLDDSLGNMESDKDNTVYRFRSDERGLQVELSMDSIAVVCFKKYNNIKRFEENVIEILKCFVEHYNDFGKFTGIDLIHRNMVNQTSMSDPDFNAKKSIPNHVFPELGLDDLDEISSLNKTIMFRSEDVLTRVRYILASINGQYGSMNIISESSFVIDIHSFYQTDIGDIHDISEYYNKLQKICWNAFHHSISEELRGQII